MSQKSCCTVILPGWSGSEFFVKRIYNKLEEPKKIFSYGSFPLADFQAMAVRFWFFLLKEDLRKKPIDVVGYSEGGIIALFAAGLFSDIIINKYISVASPHGGAFRKDNFNCGIKGNITRQFSSQSSFMTEYYPKAAESAFRHIPKSNALQIYSERDWVAQTWSTERWVDTDNKVGKMQKYLVTSVFRKHLTLPGNNDVINKIQTFLKD